MQPKTVKSRVPWRAVPAAPVCVRFLLARRLLGLLCFPRAGECPVGGSPLKKGVSGGLNTPRPLLDIPLASLRKQAGFQEFNPGVHSEEGGRCPAGPSPALRRRTPSPSSPLHPPLPRPREEGEETASRASGPGECRPGSNRGEERSALPAGPRAGVGVEWEPRGAGRGGGGGGGDNSRPVLPLRN